MTLDIKNASFGYKNSRKLFGELSFKAESSDIIAILGPNGSGKTTLLRCIMGFLRWNSGGAYIDGLDISKIKTRELWQKISYVPQAAESYSTSLVEDMILLGRTSRMGIFSSPAVSDRERVRELSEKLGISHLMQKKCTEISGGELQMVLIARAMASDPELLILDEPESNLDFRNQIIVLDAITSLARDGICVLFNTHYPEHALMRANKSLLIGNNGKAVFGSTAEIVTEENIRTSFGVNAKISEIETAQKTYRSVMPIELTPPGCSTHSAAECKRIAVISLIFTDTSQGNLINKSLGEYKEHIIGRMGMTCGDKKTHIINVTLEAEESVISSLSQNLSLISGISHKTVFDKLQ